MPLKKHILTISILSALVLAGVAATKPPAGKYKNLKILPQDISESRMDSMMDAYSKALGVGCSFCHKQLEAFPDSLDYASDDNSMKENAREMMRMTILINKTYFHFDKNQKPEFLSVVSCKTCHRGEVMPEE